MKLFELINKFDEDWEAISDIDYSLLLARVFGKPVDTATAFMYLFRRYGYPNMPSDPYKDLCAYAFRTDRKDVVVQWILSYPGDYQYHLSAYVPQKIYHKCRHKIQQEQSAWYKGFIKWATDIHGTEVYSRSDVMDNTMTKAGFRDMEKIRLSLEITKDSDPDDIFFWNYKDKQIRGFYTEYKKINPMPYTPICGNFIDIKFNQMECAEKQHAFIMTLPANHILRICYDAATELFEDWRKPVYIRDEQINLIGEYE